MITLHDKLLFAGVILLSITLMLFLNFFVYSDSPNSVVIEVDGEVYAEYNLKDIKDEKIVNVVTEYGSNKIRITDSSAEVTDASCEDKLDVISAPITKANQIIVCVPNHLTVRMKSDSNISDEIDRVAY